MRTVFLVTITSVVVACNQPRALATSDKPIGRYAIVGSVPATQPIDVAKVDSVIRATVSDKHLVGLSVGVAQDGKVVLAKGYGLKALGGHDSVTAETMFAVGSVTKQFTCSAVLLLAQDGKLTLGDPVSKYFPKLTRAADITLLDLGNHVSGYRDFYPLDFVDREMQKPATADAIIDEYATRPLDFDPGTRWSYSNTNFLILGRVVEMAGGEPFGSFLSQRIFTPVGMTHTQFDPAEHTPAMATGYTTFALGAPFPAQPEGRGWAGSAGAIWSTPSDMLAWDMALIGGKVLSDDSYRTLTTPRQLKDGRSTGYGCGDGIREEGPAVVFRHGGAVSGFVAENIVVPATRSAIVLMANTDFASLDSLENHILEKLVPHVDVPTINGPSALDAARTFLVALQRGHVDRGTLGDDYSAFLTPQLVEAATKSLGPISDVEIANRGERGGMEVAQVRFKTGKQTAGALMYRTPDGKIQEVLFQRE
jgi:D-alanyl-D-alanine carboxypeptidase